MQTDAHPLPRSFAVARLQTETEFAQALEVRQLCYRKRGKIQPSDKPLKIEEERKKSGISFGVYAEGKIVGMVRMFAPDEEDVLASVDGPLGFYPKELPQKSETIEISELCLLKEYRSIEVFKLIYNQAHRFLVENQRAWILISADRVLQKKYRFIGFKKTGYSYVKSSSAFPEISIMASNQKRFGIYGLHADPIRWNVFLRDITEELVIEKKLRPNFTHRLIFGLYKMFRIPSLALEAAIQRKVVRA